MLGLLEAAAGLPSAPGNAPEVRQLAALLAAWPLEHEVVALACTVLTRLLSRVPRTTLAAALDAGLPGVLARLLAAQEQQLQLLALPGSRPAPPDRRAPGAAATQNMPAAAAAEATGAASASSSSSGVTLSDARACAVRLLSAVLASSPEAQRAAVRGWDVVTALFALLWGPDCRETALALVLTLMAVPPETEDDRLAKAALFAKYCGGAVLRRE